MTLLELREGPEGLFLARDLPDGLQDVGGLPVGEPADEVAALGC